MDTYNDKTDGYTLNEIYNQYKSKIENNSYISVINSSNIEINGVPAIKFYLKESTANIINDNEFFSIMAFFLNINPNETIDNYSYEVIMVNGDEYYSTTYQYR